MTNRYLIILSEDPLELTATARVTDLALQLKKRGHAVALFMVQNGVFASRSRAPRDLLSPLLAAAIEMVAPGGMLVYCTCSLQPEEGPQRVAALLARGDVERLPVAPHEVGGMAELVTRDGDLRTLPCHLAEEGGIDGFYAARLRRV